MASTDLLKFYIGGYCAVFHEVTFENGELFYRTGRILPEETVRCTPDPERWASFWAAVERIGVWDWKRSYDNAHVLDGTEWSLEMRHNGRAVSSEGSNDYPGGVGMDYSDDSAFGQFLEALSQLTCGKEFE